MSTSVAIIWYGIGLVGALLTRSAFRAGQKIYDLPLDPPTVKTVVLVSLFSFLGPFALLTSALWWICVFLECHPLWTWKWVQPIKRFLNHKIG